MKTISETIKILKDYNKWRRGSDGIAPDPKVIGQAIDNAIIALSLLLSYDEDNSRI